MYYDVEVTPEEETELIEQVARKIHEYQMETPAILLLESSKPLVWIGGEMGRFFITPFVPIISDKWGVKSEKFFLIFEKRENVERLLKRLEQLALEDDEKKRAAKKAAREAAKKTGAPSEPGKEGEAAEKPGQQPAPEQKKEEKKGWRKYLPF